MSWFNLRTDTIAYKNKVMSNFEALLDGTASITAINVTDSIYIGTGSITTEAAFQVDSTSKFSMPWPVMTTAQRTALSATVGASVYDSSMTAVYVGDGSNWVQM